MKRMTEKERAGQHVRTAALSIEASNPAALAQSIEYLLEKDRWREFLSPSDLKMHTWESFPMFVEAELRTTGDSLVKALRSFPRLAAMVADLLLRPWGDNSPSPQGRGRAPHPHSSSMRMRRLMKNRPDLAERVDAEQLTLVAAWVEAGWTHEKLTVPADLAGFALHGVRRFGRETLIQAIREAKEEIRECVICGNSFRPGRSGRRQRTCGNEECKTQWRKQRQLAADRARRKDDPEYTARKQESDRRYRARKKAEKEARDATR